MNVLLPSHNLILIIAVMSVRMVVVMLPVCFAVERTMISLRMLAGERHSGGEQEPHGSGEVSEM